MDIKVSFIEKQLYSHGKHYIESSYNDIPERDIFIYEIYDEHHEDIRETVEIVDNCDADISKHKHLILYAIKAFGKLQNKIDLYENLSDEEKDTINKFKEIYK